MVPTADVSLDSSPKLADSLGAVERVVAMMALEGLSNAAIAKRRAVSPRTIANQLANVFRKMNVGSRNELAARAFGHVPLPLALGTASLSEREATIAKARARGESLKAIAIDLDLAESTVCSTLKNALKKLGLRNSCELAARYASAA